MEELLKKLGIEFAKHIANTANGKYRNEKTRQNSYDTITSMMDHLTKDHSIICRAIEGGRECHMATVTSQFYDLSSSRADKSRMYMIIGTDGVVIQVLGYDFTQEIKIFVRHPGGTTSYESYDPSLALTLVEKQSRIELSSADMEKFING